MATDERIEPTVTVCQTYRGDTFQSHPYPVRDAKPFPEMRWCRTRKQPGRMFCCDCGRVVWIDRGTIL